MKKLVLILFVVGLIAAFASCKKKFTCECTDWDTGAMTKQTVKARGILSAQIECDTEYGTSDNTCVAYK